MEEWSFSNGSASGGGSFSGASELERCHRNRWIHEPERNLMLAVLEDAIRCFLGYQEGDYTARNRLLFADAREWINSPSHHSIFAFRNLCETIGINPDRLRRELNRLRRGTDATSVSLQRIFDVRSPSMSSTRQSTASSSRTRAARAPMAASAGRSRTDLARLG
ncbi:MAG: hypothetical protein ACLQDV_09025 [Candidatus Binataceae bacterium]